MTQDTHAQMLRRLTRSQHRDVAENPLTSSRAVRMALIKAANDSIGLAVAVSSVAEEVVALDDMLRALEDDLMLVALMAADRPVGFVALDMQMRAAVLEMQTLGGVLAQQAEDRPPTLTDKLLCETLLTAVLGAFPQAVMGTPLQGWTDGTALGDQIKSARVLGLILNDRDYRVVRMSIDLTVAERQGLLLVALPLVEEPTDPVAEEPEKIEWHVAFEHVVMDACASLDAQLHRFSMPLASAGALKIGDVIPLPGCNVHSVRLLDPDGKLVAQAKLGQMSGYRALRLQPAPAPELSELAPHPRSLGLAFADQGPVAAQDDAQFAIDHAIADLSEPLTDLQEQTLVADHL